MQYDIDMHNPGFIWMCGQCVAYTWFRVLRALCMPHGLHLIDSLLMQQCAQARNNQDDGTGAVLKCLVAANDTISSSCLREVQRTAASGLMLYQPVSLRSQPG